MKRLLSASGVLGLLMSVSGAWADGSGLATLDAIKGRGQLPCGIAEGVPGFSLPDSRG